MSSHFEVSEIIEFRVNKTLIARYRPGFPYRFTEVNSPFIQGRIAEGKANEIDCSRMASMRNALGSGQSAVSGAVTVG